MGKKHYSDAIDCYSRAISQNSSCDSDQSVLFSNRAHVNLMLGNYRRAISDAEEAIKLCSTNVKDNSGVVLSKKKVLEYLLKGTVASHSECDYDEDKDEVDHAEIPNSSSSGKWIKVNEKKTLNDILKQSDYIIPAIPVFFVISKRSSFYKEFSAGNWSLP